MAQIRMLSENVIGKIAAGEVVERPAAAIKELVENSLDAGATAVLVDIQEGGIDFFRVSDNGCGIDQRDIRMAFERHATSKIRTEEDLITVGTLGFRGEALASIAAVSRVTLVTKTAGDETGLKVQNEGGQIMAMAEAACARGTTITVRNLFYNVPVRRGFLKKPATETNAVSDLMMRLILSRPDVSFRYLSNGRMIYHSPGDGQMASAVLSIYGSRAVKSMREVNSHGSGVLIRGFVGIGENARSSRSNESFFINGRMMRNPLLSGSVEDACRERVMIGKYPMCCLYLEMPYESVNVNVHPNKLEVRFRDDQAVRSAVFTAVFEALQERDAFERPVEMPLFTEKEEKSDLGPRKNPENPGSAVTVVKESSVPPLQEAPGEKPEMVIRPIEIPRRAAASAAAPAAGPSVAGQTVSAARTVPAVFSGPTVRTVPSVSSVSPISPQIPMPRPSAPGNREAGSAPMRETSFRDGLPEWEREELEPDLLPPPETAESRREAEQQRMTEAEQLSALPREMPKPMKIFGALFDTFILIEYQDHLLLVDQHAVHERLLFERLTKEYEGQRAGQEMLVPIIVSLTKREQAVLEENRELLEGIGLVTEPFGEMEVAIRTVPVVLGENESESFLREAIDELENGRMPGADKKRAAILQMACKHAVKGGEPLSESDLRHLVEQMIDQKVTPTCPHGRPLVVSISHNELDKKFKRIQ